MTPLISVVLPTIAGREAWLELALKSLDKTCPGAEVLVAHDQATCGLAWQWGAKHARGEYVLFTADDIEWLPGWWEAAADVCDEGDLPAPLILQPDGGVQSCGGTMDALEPDGDVTEFTRVPFLSAAQLAKVGQMLPIHYFTDSWVSWRGRQCGIDTVVCHAYTCIHHAAEEGKGAGMGTWERMAHDRDLYARYCSGELVP